MFERSCQRLVGFRRHGGTSNARVWHGSRVSRDPQTTLSAFAPLPLVAAYIRLGGPSPWGCW